MLNNFSCMGRFTRTPELKTTPNGNTDKVSNKTFRRKNTRT